MPQRYFYFVKAFSTGISLSTPPGGSPWGWDGEKLTWVLLYKMCLFALPRVGGRPKESVPASGIKCVNKVSK